MEVNADGSARCGTDLPVLRTMIFKNETVLTVEQS